MDRPAARPTYGNAARLARRIGVTGTLLGALLLTQACATASSTPRASTGSQPGSQLTARTPTSDKHGHPRRRVIAVKVKPVLFGLHDGSMASLQRPGVGSIRLWDAGVTWNELEPAPGRFDWGRLDRYVELAHARHAEVTLVLAGTPAWAAAKRSASSWVDPPRPTAYKSFVTAVMRRYRSFDPQHDGHGYRGIANYQVWNEPNIKTYWTGSLPQMAELVRLVWQVRHQVDRGARVIAPSMVTRLAYERQGIHRFYALKVGGRPVWRYVDAMTFSFYPVDVLPSGRPAGPEDMIDLVHAVRGVLAKDHVPSRLPIWDSEINYGLPTGSRAGSRTPTIPASRQVAFVMRTYLLSAAARLSRVFWYSYDLHQDFANTFLTDPAGRLTSAGQAFYRIQDWMHGTLVGTRKAAPCAKDRHGTYTCVVRYHRGMGRIYWNPRHRAKVTAVRSARSWVSEFGTVHRLRHRTFRVGSAPVLVRSRH